MNRTTASACIFWAESLPCGAVHIHRVRSRPYLKQVIAITLLRRSDQLATPNALVGYNIVSLSAVYKTVYIDASLQVL